MSIKINSEVENCKSVLEQYLLDEPGIKLSSYGAKQAIDSYVREHLESEGRYDWMTRDVSYRYQVGGVSELALIELCDEQKVFDGIAGKFILEEDCGPHSARYFVAKEVKD